VYKSLKCKKPLKLNSVFVSLIISDLNLCLFVSVRGERPEWKFYNVLEKIICRKDSTEQEKSINDVTIPEESSGQQAEDDTDWDVLGHVGLEGTNIFCT